MTKGRIVCEGDDAEPCKSFRAPFHLAIDQQDRIWVSNSGVDHVTRFPASDPSKAENFKDPLNSGQTPTMANFATVADALAGCATRVTPTACEMLFQAAKTPRGEAPADTLTAAEAVARAPWYLPNRLFGLLDFFYPVDRRRLLWWSCSPHQRQGGSC